MIRCEEQIDVPRRPGDVFAFLDDPARAAAWMGQCVELKETSPPPKGLGTSLLYRYREGSRVHEMIGVVTQYEPSRRLEMKFTDRAFDVTVAFDVAPTEAGTSIAYRLEADPRGLVTRLFSPVIRKAFEAQVARDAAKLREVLSEAVDS